MLERFATNQFRWLVKRFAVSMIHWAQREWTLLRPFLPKPPSARVH